MKLLLNRKNALNPALGLFPDEGIGLFRNGQQTELHLDDVDYVRQSHVPRFARQGACLFQQEVKY